MKQVHHLYPFLLLLFVLCACIQEKDALPKSGKAKVRYENELYRLTDPNEMEALFRVVLEDEGIVFSKLRIHRESEESKQVSAIVAFHKKEGQYISSVLPLDKKEALSSPQDATYSISCVMQCISSSYCQDCTQEVISECREQKCSCEDNQSCQSTIKFL